MNDSEFTIDMCYNNSYKAEENSSMSYVIMMKCTDGIVCGADLIFNR